MPRRSLFELLNMLSPELQVVLLAIILNYYSNLVELDAFLPTELSQRGDLLTALDAILDRHIDEYYGDEFILSDLVNEFLMQQPSIPPETSPIVAMIRLFYSSPCFSHMDLSYEGIIRIRNDAISRAARERDELEQDTIDPLAEDMPNDVIINGLPLQ